MTLCAAPGTLPRLSAIGCHSSVKRSEAFVKPLPIEVLGDIYPGARFPPSEFELMP